MNGFQKEIFEKNFLDKIVVLLMICCLCRLTSYTGYTLPVIGIIYKIPSLFRDALYA